MRGRAVVARKAHNLEVGGSNPLCAITKSCSTHERFFYLQRRKIMTVKELIEALQTFPDDTFVYSEMIGFYDSEDGPLNIQGCTSALNYDEKDDLLHIVANFDIATTVSK